MTDCRRCQEMIEDVMAGEASAADRDDLEEHCAACPDCAELLGLHGRLLALGDDVPVPDRQALRQMRESVLAATAKPRSKRPASRRGFLTDLGRLWRTHPLPAGLATVSVLLCAAFLGRWSSPSGTLAEDLIQQSTRWSSAGPASLDSYWDAPYTFTNVSVRPRAEGRLALSFDACRHVEMQVAQDSPLAREVLLHAILESSSLGSRLQAMEITPALRDGRLKEALILTMLNDPDAAVRLNALTVLTRYPYDQTSQEALLQTLGGDPDVQMRLLALDELTRRNVAFETLRGAMGDTDPDGNLAILREATARF